MRLPPNYGAAYAGKFQQLYVEIAKKKKVSLVPYLFEGFGEDPKYFLPDGIHPTAQAQAIMLDTVWKELDPLLKSSK